MTLASLKNNSAIDKCPAWRSEFNAINANHETLVSTGCTKDFCQAGRAVHTDEPRVGENRAIDTVEREAKEFLQTAHWEGLYDSEDAFQQRLRQVLEEIRSGVSQGCVRGDRSVAMIGNAWTQTFRELEFGVRRAWRNSRKCIMRSHCDELILCDLRNVHSSVQMAAKLIDGVLKAFCHGNIQPTVFVFPPRAINGRGPMVLNHQILQFAGYEADDGSVIGDPASIEITRTFIDLGWQPPKFKTRWDVLPLVTIAEGDKPCIAEIPSSLRKLVDIRHPRYEAEFDKLDLKWVAFPALTRLGFDIGGVQYTATPFVGWFMDAEIGVRNLADPFRYNALPDIVHELGLMEGKFVDGVEEFEDLPEFEKLAMLSRAQSELNYAVHWSFLKAQVTMTDSLTASMKWTRYDDDFRSKNGYRLPADPYWLAPPQGSIIPLWHRGGAPNYQPKPMICKHVQDPIKALAREKLRWAPGTMPSRFEFVDEDKKLMSGQNHPLDILLKPITPVQSSPPMEYLMPTKVFEAVVCAQPTPSKSVEIYYCSGGTVGEKLAIKLHKWTKQLTKDTPGLTLSSRIECINRMKISELGPNRTILLIISSTGKGEVPPNGLNALVEIWKELSLGQSPGSKRGFKFAVFGNGDSRYSNTFNKAAETFYNNLQKLGGNPLAGGYFKGDVAVEPLPLRALKTWFARLGPTLTEAQNLSLQGPQSVNLMKVKEAHPIIVDVIPIEDAVQKFDDHDLQLLSTLKEATLTTVCPRENLGSRLLCLNVSHEAIEEMSCIQILPLNAGPKVERALLALRVEALDVLDIGLQGGNPTYSKFLSEFVDLELPFLQLDWLGPNRKSDGESLTVEALRQLPIHEVLQRLRDHIHPPLDLCRKICLDMPLLRTRTYSVASSDRYISRSIANPPAPSSRKLDIMVKVYPNGRFSETFLTDCPTPSPLKYRIVDSLCAPLMRKNYLSPLLIVATGAGFGPVRSLLQWRIATAIAAGRTLPPLKRGISLFLGLKECDVELTMGVLNEALALDLVEMLEVVVSNPEKRRVFDGLWRCKGRVRDLLVGRRRGMVFVCTNRAAAEGTKRVLGEVMGGDVDGLLGGRYVEEVF